MKVKVEEEYFGTSIYLSEADKIMRISFGGNLDLYWTLQKNERGYLAQDEIISEEFVITKENYRVYELFEDLYNDIENINIFYEDEIPAHIKDPVEIKNYIDETNEYKAETREWCHIHNWAHYNDMFNPEEKTITWYSDETNPKVSNLVQIKKEEESFRLTFRTQCYTGGYDEDSHLFGLIPIRFRNSGSRYDPFNVIFMRMYNNLKEIDDINDIGHQIHIEEYLYEKNKTLIKRKY